MPPMGAHWLSCGIKPNLATGNDNAHRVRLHRVKLLPSRICPEIRTEVPSRGPRVLVNVQSSARARRRATMPCICSCSSWRMSACTMVSKSDIPASARDEVPHVDAHMPPEAALQHVSRRRSRRGTARQTAGQDRGCPLECVVGTLFECAVAPLAARWGPACCRDDLVSERVDAHRTRSSARLNKTGGKESWCLRCTCRYRTLAAAAAQQARPRHGFWCSSTFWERPSAHPAT